MISAAKWESSLPEPPKARLSERETPRDKLKHPKVLGARTAPKQGVPGQALSHRKITLGERESRSKGVGGEATEGVPCSARELHHPGKGEQLHPGVSVAEASGQVLLPSQN